MWPVTNGDSGAAIGRVKRAFDAVDRYVAHLAGSGIVAGGVIVGAIWMAVRRRVLPAVILAVTAVLVLSWYFGSNTIDPNLTSTAPYVVTLLVMAFASQHLRMPAADGDVYRKGEAG